MTEFILSLFWKLDAQDQDASMVMVRALFLGCRLPRSFYVPYGLSSVCGHRKKERASCPASLLVRTLILSDQGPTLMTSFNLNYFLGGPIS